jgi:excisionase family DNA binding protein
MEWAKVRKAAREWAGDTSPKTMYRAINKGELRAVRIGAGRNILVCREWVDAWLLSAESRPATDADGDEPPVATHRPRDAA